MFATKSLFARVRPLGGFLCRVQFGGALQDAESEFVVGGLERLLAAFGVVDVSASTDPLHDLALLIAHRQRATEMPAVGAVGSALETVFDLVVFPRGN